MPVSLSTFLKLLEISFKNSKTNDKQNEWIRRKLMPLCGSALLRMGIFFCDTESYGDVSKEMYVNRKIIIYRLLNGFMYWFCFGAKSQQVLFTWERPANVFRESLFLCAGHFNGVGSSISNIYNQNLWTWNVETRNKISFTQRTFMLLAHS